MVLDLEPLWLIVFWIVMALGALVSGLAVWILLGDWLEARRTRQPTRSVIRERLRQLPPK